MKCQRWHRSRKMHMFNGLSNTKTAGGVEQYTSMKPPTNYLETSFIDGQEIQNWSQENSNEQTEDYDMGRL
jgi:hypothetical protein